MWLFARHAVMGSFARHAVMGSFARFAVEVLALLMRR
jgi:hypothetical protein